MLASLRRLPSALILPFLAASAGASPIVYTFAGTVYASTSEALPTGSPVTYAFLADFELPGNYAFGSGATSPGDNDSFDYFFVSYLSGDAISQDLSGSRFTGYQYEYGVDLLQSPGAYLLGSNADLTGRDYIRVRSPLSFSDWAVGQAFTGENLVNAAVAFQDWNIYSSLTLVSMHDPRVAVVPEPGTVALFGSGILALGLFRRRKTS